MSGLGEKGAGSEREAAAAAAAAPGERAQRALRLCASARLCSWHAHCLGRGGAASEGRGGARESRRARPRDALRVFDSTNGRSDTCVCARACVCVRFCFCLCSLLCFRCFVVLLRLNFLPLPPPAPTATSTIGANDPPTLSLVPWKHKRPIPSKISRKFTSDLPILQTSQTLMRPPHARCPPFPMPAVASVTRLFIASVTHTEGTHTRRSNKIDPTWAH